MPRTQGTLLLLLALCAGLPVSAQKQFKVWVSSDSHITIDKLWNNGRRPIKEAIAQSEFGDSLGAPPFDWDIMLHLGDISGSATGPTTMEGENAAAQLNSGKLHSREQIYNLMGNHDASKSNEPENWWFQQYIDPMGENPSYSGVDSAARPFPAIGTYERYTVQVGNLFFLMVSDRNDFPKSQGGRGLSGDGYPAGKITAETYNWWKQQINENTDKNVISCHHHMLKNTTIGTGVGEGTKFHGKYPNGYPQGAAYLYFVGEEADQELMDLFLATNQCVISLYMGGHTHPLVPDANYNGRTTVGSKHGITFLNVAALAKFTTATSRLITFTDGSSEARVQHYLHTEFEGARGWYAPNEFTVQLAYPFIHPDRYTPGMVPEASSLVKLDQNYPNPTNKRTKIEFQLDDNQLVDILIYDGSGRQVDRIEHKCRGVGKHRVNYDVRHLGAGAYFIVLRTDEKELQRKMIVVD